MLAYHMAGFFIGFVLDLLLGDPYFIPHPIRWIGRLISFLEGILLKKKEGKEVSDKNIKRRGYLLVVLVLTATGAVAFFILCIAFFIHGIVLCIVEAVMTYQILALKSLKYESMKVYKELLDHKVERAREAVSMIVGRDTAVLDEIGITKAAVETVAENCSDGVIAPMLYLAIGGPVLGFLYKAVNTMDSMVGYKNEKYLHFGYAAAGLDDIVNFLPARISSVLMVLSSFLLGRDYDGKQAYRIFQRDRYQHASPNSAQTEAVCAGALGIRLAGDAVYFGKTVKKPYIGDERRPVEYEDIVRVNKLLYLTAFLGEGICLLLMGLIMAL